MCCVLMLLFADLHVTSPQDGERGFTVTSKSPCLRFKIGPLLGLGPWEEATEQPLNNGNAKPKKMEMRTWASLMSRNTT